MSVESLIARMRDREDDLVTETVTFVRTVGRGALNPVTASYGDPVTVEVYSGAAQVRPDGEQVVDAGEESVDVSGYLVKVPADTDVQLGDVGTIDSSTYDAGLVGLSLRVVAVTNDGWQVRRRARCTVAEGRPT